MLYTDWIKRSNRINWYGLQGRLRREFSDWILHSGSVYKTPWPPAGQVFAITSVEENGVALAQGASAALSAGQWWQDRSVKPNMLYVRMSDSSNPYTKTIIGHFTARFASGVPVGKKSNDLNGVPWRSCISTSSIPEISQTLGNVFLGSAVFGSIKISFVNADGWFDEYNDDWIWKDSEFDFLHGDGGVELSFAEHRLTTFICSNADEINERVFTITLENLLQVLSKPALQSIFDVAVYPNMDPTLQGKWIPELHGQNSVPSFPIDLHEGTFKVTGEALDSIDAVSIAGIDVARVDDLANGEFTLFEYIVKNVVATAKAGGELGAGTYYIQVAALVPGVAE